MRTVASRIADFLRHQSFVKVVTHIDADGLTSGAIASLALDRVGIPHEVEFIKQLDDPKVKELRDFDDTIWFTDLGSGKLPAFDPERTLVTDHHVPQSGSMGMVSQQTKVRSGGQTNLFDFNPAVPEREPYHLNPHLFGRSGANEISGAGVTYMVAKALDPRNTDLSSLAVVGAVGDLQDAANCRLIELNRGIVEDGVNRGVVETDNDIRYFGRETRPIYKLLQYSSDPIIPSISGNEAGAIEFLVDLGIEFKDGDNFRHWIDLERSEKRRVISGMVKLALTMGLEPGDVRRMVGEVYQLPLEEAGTPLHDAKEFATMLNACGKNLNPEVGFQVCKGDREEFLDRAYLLLKGHRRNLAGFIQLVEQELGIQQRDIIQYFDGGEEIPENLVGIVAGMLLNSGSADLGKVMLGLAAAEGGLKVSARTTRLMVKNGIDLAAAQKNASQKVGGEGGGHNIAAGAFIPREKLEEFLDIFEKILKDQISSGK